MLDHNEALIPVPDNALSLGVRLQAGAVAAEAYARRSRSTATQRAYASDWTHFNSWCQSCGVVSLPADPRTIAAYLGELAATLKPATIERRVSAISEVHADHEFASPASHPMVRATLRGIRASAADKGIRQTQKAPALKNDLTRMLESLPANGLIAARDRALLLVGFGAALRRSELAALTVADITFEGDRGVTVLIRRSKTDQSGVGLSKAIQSGRSKSTCAASAVREWLALAGITEGPVFRPINRHGQVGADAISDHAIAKMVKARAGAVGLDPAQYSGHSLRAGLATSAALAGASAIDIARQTGHASLDTVKRYVRVADLWKNNVTGLIGL